MPGSAHCRVNECLSNPNGCYLDRQPLRTLLLVCLVSHPGEILQHGVSMIAAARCQRLPERMQHVFSVISAIWRLPAPGMGMVLQALHPLLAAR